MCTLQGCRRTVIWHCCNSTHLRTSYPQHGYPVFNILLWKIIEYRNIRRICRSQWPRGVRGGSAAARLLGLWVRIPPRAWMTVCCECCVLSGRGLIDELITHPEESYRLCCVVECDLETTWMRRPWPTEGGGAVAPNKIKELNIEYRVSNICLT